MSDSVETVMRKIRDYVKKVSQEDLNDFKLENSLVKVFDLEELLKNREENNNNWNVKTEFPVLSARKFVGRLITIYKKLLRKSLRWYINPIVQQQNTLNGSLTRSINEISNTLHVINSEFDTIHSINKEISDRNRVYEQVIDDLKSELEKITFELSRKINLLEDKITEKNNLLEDKITEKNNLLENMDFEINNLKTELDNFSLEVKDKDTKIDNLSSFAQKEINTFRESIDKKCDSDFNKLSFENTYLSSRIRRLEGKVLSKSLNNAVVKIREEEKSIDYGSNIIDYFLFENRYRGPEALIKSRQGAYLEYFKNDSTVLDIGCGRGEFLELLSENGISAKGIDINEDFIEYCDNKGLEVYKEDAVTFLAKLDDNSLDGITLFQVVEHLEYNYLLCLLENCYKKLKNKGVIIIETPNPKTLAIYTNAFYVDPTHIKPVHPETLKFSMSSVGFNNIIEKLYDHSLADYKIPLLNSTNVENLLEFNNGINVLNNLLFGFQDYSIIAYK